jgi:WD repeat-containing protein 23
VCYLDPNLIISGGDDTNIRLWDSRLECTKPVAFFSGHLDGITSIDSKSDGRVFFSNSKDQSLKQWDVRKPTTSENKPKVDMHWDYRYQQCPNRFKKRPDHLDGSIFTFYGHRVLQTQVRCHVSPEQTGQRFVFSGSQDGSIFIFDSFTGETAKVLKGHTSVIRDCAWHPTCGTIVASSWDRSISSWEYKRSFE